MLGRRRRREDEEEHREGEEKDALLCWAELRNGTPLTLDNSDGDVFNVAMRSNNADFWNLAIHELPHRHPGTGDTLFHAVCKSALSESGKLRVIERLKSMLHNPLTPNFVNQMAVSLAREVSVRHAIEQYMQWQPIKERMWWWGPCFRLRAVAVLLVLYRHNRGKCGWNVVPREVRIMIVKCLAREEFTYVPTRLR